MIAQLRLLHNPRRMAALERVKIAYTMHDQEGFPFVVIANVLGYASQGSASKAVFRYRKTRTKTEEKETV